MVSARRVSLFEREIRVRLSSAALEIMFDLAAVLSEGQVDDDSYFGSTMVTIDISRAAAMVTDTCDTTASRRIEHLLETDERIRAYAHSLAKAEAQRLAGDVLAEPQIDCQLRRSGTHLHLDIDIEALVTT